MNNRQIRAIFLVILIIILFILVFLIFKPFFTLILWATVLTIMIRPLYSNITLKFKFVSKSDFLKRIIAAIFSLLIVLIIIVPVIIIFYRLSIEFKQFSIWIDNILKTSEKISFENLNNFIEKIVYKLTAISIEFDIIEEITKFIKIKSFELTPIITTLLSKIINTVVGVFFLMLTIYFMLTDGEILVKYFKDALPIDNKYINNFSSKVYQVMDIIIKGYFIIGFYQSIVLFLLLMIFKYSNPFLFSTITFISSFIPMLGATVVWLPIAFLIGITKNIF
ncbi:MAG: AI-2E family transporter, partial [Exilispira sp.]